MADLYELLGQPETAERAGGGCVLVGCVDRCVLAGEGHHCRPHEHSQCDVLGCRTRGSLATDEPTGSGSKRLSEASDGDASFHLNRESCNPVLVARFTIAGEPSSKARARYTKSGHTYSPAANRSAEALIGLKFKAASDFAAPNADKAFGVIALFFSSTRQRRDVDNMLKLVLDGLNKVAWADDSQVTEISGRKELINEPEDARTEVAVYELGRVPGRTAKCEHCGKEYPVYRSQKSRRFCSAPCGLAHRRKARTRICEHCGTAFEESHATRKFCSIACKSAALRTDLICAFCGRSFTQPQSLARRSSVPTCSAFCRAAYWRSRGTDTPKGTCATCKGPTSKSTYTTCAACSAALQGGPQKAHTQTLF